MVKGSIYFLNFYSYSNLLLIIKRLFVMAITNLKSLVFIFLGCFVGCSQTTKQSARMHSDSNVSTEKLIRRTSQKQDAGATKEAAIRVGKIGQKLLASNPSLGIKPIFQTIGAPQPEVFHQGLEQIMVTDSLVKECDDDQLAAVLAVELAKMVGERENSAPPGKIIDRTPGMDFNIGNDRSLGFGPADGTRLAERYALDRQRNSNSAPSSDPKITARLYLSKAGYPSKSVESISNLLKKADENFKLEKQMTHSSSQAISGKVDPVISQ